MKPLFVLSALVLIVTSAAIAKTPYVLILGTSQDAGVPQIGCDSPFCRKAWVRTSERALVSSIALVDPQSGERWIFDATPDLPLQFEMLRRATRDRSVRIDGIFLTHAHIGHYTGLMYLGRESMNAKRVKVYAMPRMRQMIESNAPWSQLVTLENISLVNLADKTEVKLNDRLTVEPFVVPHRDEFSETVGFRIRSGNKALIFIPDIDKWQKWSTPLSGLVTASDHLLLDGTFYADGEINRPMSEVPHPFVAETMELLRALPADQRSKVHFIHFNHSNPLVQGNPAKLREVKRLGFRIARRGMRFDL